LFRTANPEDERLILPQFQPYVEKGEIASLPSYRFYMRLGALNPEEPFSGETILTEINENDIRVNETIDSSRRQYAIKYEEIVSMKEKLFIRKQPEVKVSQINKFSSLTLLKVKIIEGLKIAYNVYR